MPKLQNSTKDLWLRQLVAYAPHMYRLLHAILPHIDNKVVAAAIRELLEQIDSSAPNENRKEDNP